MQQMGGWWLESYSSGTLGLHLVTETNKKSAITKNSPGCNSDFKWARNEDCCFAMKE